MQTRIRLSRFGAKKKPYYRIVVSSVTSSRDGRFLEVVGHYDPRLGIEKADLNQERVSHWISRGAQPTQAVKQIIKNVAA